jgi:hypothetical protein
MFWLPNIWPNREILNLNTYIRTEHFFFDAIAIFFHQCAENRPSLEYNFDPIWVSPDIYWERETPIFFLSAIPIERPSPSKVKCWWHQNRCLTQTSRLVVNAPLCKFVGDTTLSSFSHELHSSCQLTSVVATLLESLYCCTENICMNHTWIVYWVNVSRALRLFP